MKRNLVICLFLTLIVSVFWYPAFFNFFAQDDFILINHFSQNNFWQDFKNVFALPSVTHWRPIHNSYFLVAGNLFGKNFFGYHLITFIIHASTSFFIYKVAAKIISSKTALIASLFYALHPAHFVSLTWISGAATTIGFFFLAASFYSYLQKKNKLALTFYIAALLSSEAMLVGLGIFLLWGFLKEGLEPWKNFIFKIMAVSVAFIFFKLLFFTHKTTFVSYEIEVSGATLLAIKYYILRILGFAEVSGDQLTTLVLVLWVLIIGFLITTRLTKNRNLKVFVFLASVIVLGLFPFILIPHHLSPHYMNISIWAFGLLIAWAFSKLKPLVAISLFLIFAAIAVFNVQLTKENSWVTMKSDLAKFYIKRIELFAYPSSSTIVFADNEISTSEEKYIALGTGEAIKFWFVDKNYKLCFTFFEHCSYKNYLL